jgi:tRNA(Arg) A34 adenosine deaminase TadA
MCAGAIHWGNIGRLVFGLSGPAFYAMVGAAPDLLKISCREVLVRAVRPITVIGPLLEDKALAEHAGFWPYYGG